MHSKSKGKYARQAEQNEHKAFQVLRADRQRMLETARERCCPAELRVCSAAAVSCDMGRPPWTVPGPLLQCTSVPWVGRWVTNGPASQPCTRKSVCGLCHLGALPGDGRGTPKLYIK